MTTHVPVNDTREMENAAFDKACRCTGGLTKLAAVLNRTKQALNHYKTSGVPDDMCPLIERATKFEVTCEELRPDLNWVRVADAEWQGGKPLLDLMPSESVGAGA